MSDPAAQISYDDVRDLLATAQQSLRDYETAMAAAGTNSGIEYELGIKRAEVERLAKILREWDQPARQTEPVHPVIEALPPSPILPPPAIRAAKGQGTPRLSDGHTATGFGAQPGAFRHVVRKEKAQPAAEAAVAPAAGVPLAGVTLPNGPTVVITALPNGEVRAEIQTGVR